MARKVISSAIFALLVLTMPGLAADNCDTLDGDAAIAACTRAIKSGKFKGRNLAIEYFNRGLAYSGKDELDLALADFSAAIQLDPKYTKAFNYRGVAYRDKGEYARALPDFDEALRLDPKLVTAYVSRGYNYDAMGESEKAIADYNRAIEIQPQNLIAYIDRGYAHEGRGEFELAIADYNEAIRILPKFTLAYRNRGRSRLYTGNAARALTDLTEAAELNPKDAYGQIWLDIIGQRNGAPSRLAQSISSLDMTRWPAPVVRLFLGQLTPAAALQAADDPNAKKKAEQSCEATFYTGEFLLRQDKQEAAKLFQHAVDNCPTQNIIERNSARTELKLLGGGH